MSLITHQLSAHLGSLLFIDDRTTASSHALLGQGLIPLAALFKLRSELGSDDGDSALPLVTRTLSDGAVPTSSTDKPRLIWQSVAFPFCCVLTHYGTVSGTLEGTLQLYWDELPRQAPQAPAAALTRSRLQPAGPAADVSNQPVKPAPPARAASQFHLQNSRSGTEGGAVTRRSVDVDVTGMGALDSGHQSQFDAVNQKAHNLVHIASSEPFVRMSGTKPPSRVIGSTLSGGRQMIRRILTEELDNFTVISCYEGSVAALDAMQSRHDAEHEAAVREAAGLDPAASVDVNSPPATVAVGSNSSPATSLPVSNPALTKSNSAGGTVSSGSHSTPARFRQSSMIVARSWMPAAAVDSDDDDPQPPPPPPPFPSGPGGLSRTLTSSASGGYGQTSGDRSSRSSSRGRHGGSTPRNLMQPSNEASRKAKERLRSSSFGAGSRTGSGGTGGKAPPPNPKAAAKAIHEWAARKQPSGSGKALPSPALGHRRTPSRTDRSGAHRSKSPSVGGTPVVGSSAATPASKQSPVLATSTSQSAMPAVSLPIADSAGSDGTLSHSASAPHKMTLRDQRLAMQEALQGHHHANSSLVDRRLAAAVSLDSIHEERDRLAAGLPVDGSVEVAQDGSLLPPAPYPVGSKRMQKLAALQIATSLRKTNPTTPAALTASTFVDPTSTMATAPDAGSAGPRQALLSPDSSRSRVSNHDSGVMSPQINMVHAGAATPGSATAASAGGGSRFTYQTAGAASGAPPQNRQGSIMSQHEANLDLFRRQNEALFSLEAAAPRRSITMDDSALFSQAQVQGQPQSLDVRSPQNEAPEYPAPMSPVLPQSVIKLPKGYTPLKRKSSTVSRTSAASHQS